MNSSLPSEVPAGQKDHQGRLQILHAGMESLIGLGQALTSQESGLNLSAVADALLSHLATAIQLDHMGVFAFDEGLNLQPVATWPQTEQEVLTQIVDEAIEDGIVAQALVNNRAVHRMGDGSCLVLRSLRSRTGVAGMLAVLIPSPLLDDTSSDLFLCLDAAANLAGYAMSAVRLQADLARQNQELQGLIARRTHEAQEAARSAQNAERVKHDFLATMSHEIRTPLNGIIGLLDLLKDDSRLDLAARETVDTVLSCSTGLLGLINDILDLARIDAGRLELQPIPFRPHQVLEELGEVAAMMAQRKNLTFQARIQVDPQVRFLGDPARLRQVLFNLLGNAVKFTELGVVTLQALIQPVPGKDGGQELRCAVIDSGIGIPEEHVGRLFEPFYQVESHPSRPHGGSGLGLTICAKLTRLMQGRIDLISRPGHGSTFTLIIPLAPAPLETSSPAKPGSHTESSLDGLRVLVVEDNPVNQQVVTRLLERLKCDPRTADCGQAALEMLERERFDVVLMDIEMPGLDGYRVTSMIRERELSLGGHVPIIAVTAHALEEHRRKAADAGMDDYLAKPISRQHLRVVLARHAPKRGGASPSP